MPTTRKDVEKELEKPLPPTQPSRDKALEEKSQTIDRYVKENPEGH